jgi:ATP-dependent DNA helicase RecG
MDRAELEQLLLDLESDRVERTTSLTDTAKFSEAICSFANDLAHNQKPGYLFVNANPDGTAGGGIISDQLLQNLASLRSDGQIQPFPVMTVQKHRLGGGEMAVVEVFPADQPPVRYKGRVCVRVGPRRSFASVADERVLSERRSAREKTWDARPCSELTLDDIALDLFLTTYRSAAIDPVVIAENERDIKLQLASLRFFDLRTDRPTNAAVMLFGKDPCSIAPGAYVQYVRYDGALQSDPVSSERRFSGDLTTVMRELDLLVASIANERPIVVDGPADRTVADYPARASHELIMNAVIHRTYDASTTPTMISHFNDKIEILNPGGLYGDLTRQDFPRLTSYRNPIIAEAAKTLGFVNRFGRGIDLAQTLLQRNGSAVATFDVEGNYFLATMQRRP